MIDIKKLNFEKLYGLIPAVVVDVNTDQVLMVGFMNEESVLKTISTKRVTFFSRTKNKLWTKGETSSNYLNLIDIKSDCDNDTVLVYANPEGNTCHTGAYSCFDIEKMKDIKFLTKLFNLIQDRKINLPEDSYTTKLFKDGIDKIVQKVGEESVETVIAAKNSEKDDLINEVSDLIYHLFVLLSAKDIELEEVVSNLEKRHKT